MNKRPNKRNETKRLVICALLAATGAVLGGLISIPVTLFGAYSLKIGFASLPVLLSAILYGPVAGGAVGAVADIIQAIAFPKGAFMPLFTVVAALSGAIPGCFFLRPRPARFPRVFFAVLTGQLTCSAFLNTLLITCLYGTPFAALFPLRLLNQAVMIPLYAVTLTFLIKALDKGGLIDPINRRDA